MDIPFMFSQQPAVYIVPDCGTPIYQQLTNQSFLWHFDCLRSLFL